MERGGGESRKGVEDIEMAGVCTEYSTKGSFPGLGLALCSGKLSAGYSFFAGGFFHVV